MYSSLARDLWFAAFSNYSASIPRSEEHTSELQSRLHLVCRLLLEKKNHAICAAALEMPTPTTPLSRTVRQCPLPRLANSIPHCRIPPYGVPRYRQPSSPRYDSSLP